ncbi:MAG: hypothetical protein HYS78_02400 [Parcubacteria group bacterium]|nr:hypothetical protein [Parcubacteria group bacterium]
MTSVLDLKNPKNRKVNNYHPVSDVLNGDLKDEAEFEPIPIAPTKKSPPPVLSNPPKKEDFFENLEVPQAFDKKADTPDNSGDMTPLTTFAHAPLEAARARSESSPLMGSLAWFAPDKNHELISHTWRKGVIIILVAMAFAALLWQGSILTAITFFALAMVTSMHFWREARHEKYEIHPHGILAGGQFLHYHDLDSFWIHYHPQGEHELSLCTGRFLNYYVKIPLKGQDPVEVRDVLMRYLPEERHEEGLEDLLRRKLGL